MHAVNKFAKNLNAEFSAEAEHVFEDKGRYYLVSKRLLPFVQKGFFHAGIYLGKIKEEKFFPSFSLLSKLSESGGRSVYVDKKAAWLFICGRDIFLTGITALRGPAKKGDFVLVLNEFGDCLGFGKTVMDLQSGVKTKRIAVRNVSDIGDFLRRER